MEFIDIGRQYKTIQKEVEERVLGVMRGAHYIMGPEVRQFEQSCADYFQVKNAISVGNGTDALVMALAALGIGPGDEVITTPFTFFATAESICRVGATPVFVDIDDDTLNIDASLIEEKVTPKTKALLPVHIFGNACDMDAIHRIAKDRGLYVIEDACQAIGGEYKGKKLGTLSDIACFSFFPTKNLGGMGDGGLIVTEDDRLADIMRALKNHGSGAAGRKAYELLNRDFQETKKVWKGFEKYYNYLIGYNSRLDEIQAAVLNVKMKHIERWNEARREAAAYYDSRLEGKFKRQLSLEEGLPVYHMYALRNPERADIADHLSQKGIPVGIYYPIPLHLQNVFTNLGYKEGDLPVVEKVCEEIFSVPLFPELQREEQDEVIHALLESL